MDSNWVDGIVTNIQKINSHAKHFMNDPPSRSWVGFAGRCNEAKKKSQQITDETLLSFNNLVSWANNQLTDYKQQIQSFRQDCQNYKEQLYSLQNMNNQ